MGKQSPHSKDELLGSLEDLAACGLDFWRDMPAETFTRELGDAWSPADNVRHLVKSTVPVVTALRLPRLLLGVVFGRATVASSTYTELRDRYHSVLASGATAGRYAPSPATATDDAAAWQAAVVARCEATIRELARALGGWGDSDLDHYRLPHPLLGKLTVREMVLFTLYHHEHHKAGVAKRLAALTGPPN